MSGALPLAIGIGLALAGWLATRASAGAWRLARPAAWAFDLLVPAVLFAAALATFGRPVLGGVMVGAGLGAIAFADGAKRRFLGEPVVFTDLGLLPKLVTRSELYIAFVGYGRVVGGALAAAVALSALFLLEPPLPFWSPLEMAASAAVVLSLLALGVGPGVGWLAAPLRRFRVSGDPIRDSAELGLCGMQFIHGVVARAGRPALRTRLAPPVAVVPGAVRRDRDAGPPVLLFQLESFADPRRIHPALAGFALPAWERLSAEAAERGRLDVPGVGGNTMRTEFAVLSGRPPADLGLDRLHPYQAISRGPVDTLAWRLKARGYRTVCLHPYDRSFYGRDHAMPHLGFDRFLGEEAFRDAPRLGRYVSDMAVAELALRIVEEEGPATLVFAITMGAHGPWETTPEHSLPGLAPEAVRGLGDYLHRLEQTDLALERLAAALAVRGDGVLGLYGDHLPSLPALWSALGAPDARTDHLLWRPGAAPAGAATDLDAHQLAGRLLAVLDATRHGEAAGVCERAS